MRGDDFCRNIDRRRFIKLATVAGGGIVLLGCAPSPVAPTAAPRESPTIAAPTPTATPTPKPLANLGFAGTSGGVGPQMIPLLVAQELFLKEEGIAQKATPFQGGGDSVRAVVTGGQQIGHPSPASVAIAVEQGQPIRIIGENQPFASIAWIVRDDSSLRSMKDLKGKKLGYSRPGSVSMTYALIALRKAGLEPDADVSMVAAGGPVEQLAAVQGGTVDAGWLTDPLLTQELLKKSIRVLAYSHELIPAWSESMLASTAEYAGSNGDVLTAYLRAHQKAMEYIKSDPEKTAEIWARGQDITIEVARAALKNYPLQGFTSRIDPATLSAIGDDLVSNRQLREMPDWKTVVDQSFLAPDLRTQV